MTLMATEKVHRSRPAPPFGGSVAIEVCGLSKRYGTREVVKGIDFSVRCGEVFAFLGPNGAGKTTTVQVLEGFVERDGGTVRVLGVDPRHATGEWRDRVGVVLQSSVPEPDLTVRETIEFYAGFYRRPLRCDEALGLTGLTEQANMRNRRLSGGQQRRLDVALALIGDPDVLFLDEPTTGFDPVARRSAWETVASLKHMGKTVFLTTHYLDEAEYLADRIAVIAEGSIVAVGTPESLAGRDRLPSTVSFRLEPGPGPGAGHRDHPPHLDALGSALSAHVTGPVRAAEQGRYEVESRDPVALVSELARWAGEKHMGAVDLRVTKPSLEETYMELVARGQA